MRHDTYTTSKEFHDRLSASGTCHGAAPRARAGQVQVGRGYSYDIVVQHYSTSQVNTKSW